MPTALACVLAGALAVFGNGPALAHRLFAATAMEGAFGGRACVDAAHPPRLIVDASQPVATPVALRLGDVVWLRAEPDGRIAGIRGDAGEAAGSWVRDAAGIVRVRVAIDDADCRGAASIEFAAQPQAEVDADAVIAATATTRQVATALAMRRNGGNVQARRELAAALGQARAGETRRWVRLHLARTQLELGDVPAAERSLAEARADASAPHAGLDLFAALLEARLDGWRGAFRESVAAREALATRLAAQDGASEDRVANDVYLAGIDNFLGKTDAASARMRAVERSIGELAPADPLRVDAAVVESQIHGARDDGEAAERVLLQALARLPASPATYTFAHAQLVSELGTLRVGDRPLDGLAPMRRAVAWYAGNLGEQNPLTIVAEAVLAALQAHAGRIDEAIATQRRVVAYYNLRARPNDLRAIVAEHALANYLVKARRWGDGIDSLLPAIRRADAVGDSLAAQRAHMRMDLASARWELDGADAACGAVAEARALAARAELYEQQELDLRMLEAACLARRDARAGIAALERLRDARVARFGATSRAAIFGHSALARQLIAAGATAAATAELERMTSALESVRDTELPEAGGGRAMFADWLDTDALYAGYRDLAWLYFVQRRVEDAIRIAEATRARTVEDVLGLRDRVDALVETDKVRALTIAARMRELESDTALLPAGSIERAGLDDERARLASELDAIVAGARTSPPSTLDALRRRIPAGTAYVGVQLVHGDAWAYVVRRDRKPVALALPKLVALAGALPYVVAALARPDPVPVKLWRVGAGHYMPGLAAPEPGATGATVEQMLAATAAALFAPLAPHLADVRHLAIAIDAPFSSLPLDVLARDRPLSIDIAPSLASWIALHDRVAPAYRLDVAAITPPDYERLTEAPRARPANVPPRWPPLPGARDEVRDVASLFAPLRTRVLEASKPFVTGAAGREALGRARFVHVAAHAYLSTSEPSWSSLVMAGGERQLAYLTAAELATFSIRSELVVLSACETGLGREVPGEGLFGLPYAMIVAGARAAVLTLWPVADESTAEFMKRFYAKLARGIRPSAALAATKREFMRHPRWSAPFFWAPFVLYGAGS